MLYSVKIIFQISLKTTTFVRLTHPHVSKFRMPFDNDDLPEFCTNLEEKDIFDNLIYIWVVPMGILVLCNLCGCRILTVNSFILFFIIYSGGIFAAIFFIQCGCCNVMPYFMSIPWSMTIAAWLLSWYE